MSTETPHNSTRDGIFFFDLVKFISNAYGLSLFRTVNTNSLDCSTNVCKNLKIHNNECSQHGERLIRFSPFTFFPTSAHMPAHIRVCAHSLPPLTPGPFCCCDSSCVQICAYAVHGISVCVCSCELRLHVYECQSLSLLLRNSVHKCYAVHWYCRHYRQGWVGV